MHLLPAQALQRDTGLLEHQNTSCCRSVAPIRHWLPFLFQDSYFCSIGGQFLSFPGFNSLLPFTLLQIVQPFQPKSPRKLTIHQHTAASTSATTPTTVSLETRLSWFKKKMDEMLDSILCKIAISWKSTQGTFLVLVPLLPHLPCYCYLPSLLDYLTRNSTIQASHIQQNSNPKRHHQEHSPLFLQWLAHILNIVLKQFCLLYPLHPLAYALLLSLLLLLPAPQNTKRILNISLPSLAATIFVFVLWLFPLHGFPNDACHSSCSMILKLAIKMLRQLVASSHEVVCRGRSISGTS
jgi:hypothetical protein